MQQIRFLFVLVVFSMSLQVSAQQDVNFQHPVDGTITLSATFGELREGHLHTGIDITTGGVEGKKVYSVYDGYISRIVVSPYGYGKCLYITHPNGYTSVYAHLKSFTQDVSDYVREQQYKKKSFKVDLYLPKDKFKIKKGQLIAKSGNSGGSGGPHLHFEIRETGTEFPVNPQLFNFTIEDDITPLINSIAVFPYNNESFVNGKNKMFSANVIGKGKNQKISPDDTIKIAGPVYFGINTYDKINGRNNKNGVYSITCTFDDETIYDFSADKHSFSLGRCVNSVMDYPAYKQLGRRYYKTFREPNNTVMFTKQLNTTGLIKLVDEQVHKVNFEVKDVRGNTASVNFYVVVDDKHREVSPHVMQYNFDYRVDNAINQGDLIVNIPALSLFDNISFDVKTIYDGKESAENVVYRLGDNTITSFKPFDLSMPLVGMYAGEMGQHAYLAYKTKKGWKRVGSKVENGRVKAKVYDFGDYRIMVDTITPNVQCATLPEGQTPNLVGKKNLTLKIYDKDTDIASYYPTLNGEWILMDYDAKNDVITYHFDDKLKKGTNNLKIVVKDHCNNVTTLERTFIY